MAQQENERVRTLEDICEDITARQTDGRFHFPNLTGEAKASILIEAAEIYAYQAAYFASKTAMLDKFPNGFTDWMETFYEVATFIETQIGEEKLDNAILDLYNDHGTGIKYELAEEWTNEFENLYKNIPWGEKYEFLEELEKFLGQKIRK